MLLLVIANAVDTLVRVLLSFLEILNFVLLSSASDHHGLYTFLYTFLHTFLYAFLYTYFLFSNFTNIVPIVGLVVVVLMLVVLTLIIIIAVFCFVKGVLFMIVSMVFF